MVLLTTTSSIVEALRIHSLVSATEGPHDDNTPSLEDPQVGRPISHGQIVDLWKNLSAEGRTEYTLEKLLRGSRVYVPPPPPKQEPVGPSPPPLPSTQS